MYVLIVAAYVEGKFDEALVAVSTPPPLLSPGPACNLPQVHLWTTDYNPTPCTSMKHKPIETSPYLVNTIHVYKVYMNVYYKIGLDNMSELTTGHKVEGSIPGTSTILNVD